jgi:hypothetical protein
MEVVEIGELRATTSLGSIREPAQSDWFGQSG